MSSRSLIPFFAMALLLQFGCNQSTDPKEYARQANSTYLQEHVSEAPKTTEEREVAEKIDALFADAPGYRSYKESIGQRSAPPQLLKAELPVYPKWAVAKKIAARVLVAARVDTDGSIMETKIFSTTDERLNDAALTAVRKWKFTPGKRNGEPDRFVMVVPVEFRP